MISIRNTVKAIQDIMRQDAGVDGDAQRISQLCWMFFLKILDDQDQQLELMDPDYRSPMPDGLRWGAWAGDPEGLTGDGLLAFINNHLFPSLKNLSPAGPQERRQRVVRAVFEDAYNYMKSGHLLRQVINKINEIDFNDLAEREHFGDVYEQLLNDLQSAGNAGEYYTPRAVTAFMAERVDPHPGEILLDPACGTGGFLTCAIRHMREHYVKTPDDEALMQASLRAVEKKPLPHMLCTTNMLLHGIEDPSFVRHDNTLARPYVSYGDSDRVDIVLTNPPFGGREEPGIESNFPKHFQTRETADLFLALIIRLLRKAGRAAVVLPDGSLFGEGVKTRLKEVLLAECNLHTIVRLPNSVFRPYASIGTNLLFFEKGSPTKEIWYYEHRVPEGQKAYSMTKPIRLEHLAPCVAWWGGSSRKGRVITDVVWKVTIDEVQERGCNLDIKNPHVVDGDHESPEELLRQLDGAEAEVRRITDHLTGLLSKALLP
jgi:type I restriction enzyme M protein